MEEIVKTQQVDTTRGRVRTPDAAAKAEKAALRSTGDARKVVGASHGRQREQPSLGDPENAPGQPQRRVG